MAKITNQYTARLGQKPKWEKTADGFMRCRARVLRQCVMPYSKDELQGIPSQFQADMLNMFVPADAMSTPESIRTLEGAPIVDWDHTWASPENIKQIAKGSVAGTPTMDGEYLLCDLLITDPQTILDIEEGNIGEISAAYHADTVFGNGDYNGEEYNAKQVNLQYNHIAIIPAGHGRAGSDVRILNKQKKENGMAEDKVVRVQLRNSGKILNTDEEGAKMLNEEYDGMEEGSAASGKQLEEVMTELESKNGELTALQAETEELKGELSVYKDKLDQLLSDSTIEAAAENMIEEQGEATEILANADMYDDQMQNMDEEKAEEFMNSLKRLHGTPLHQATLAAIGVKCENMSPEALRGAFKAQNSIVQKTGGKKTVAGARLSNSMIQNNTKVAQRAATRTPMQRLGFGAPNK